MELLVVERLLPEDIRTESHYRALLADMGFELTATVPLPLDAYALRARKRSVS